MKKNKPLKALLKVVCGLLAAVITLLGCFLIFATVTTLKVQDTEAVAVIGTGAKEIKLGSTLSLLTWNVGYGALDERQDCYWDGGKGVDGESKEVVLANVAAMRDKIAALDPDILLLQEVDLDSKRSYRINELDEFAKALSTDRCANTFAKNFKAGCVPLPLYNPTGRVNAGIAVFSSFFISSATRVQLPIPFSWPMSLFNLKRCLLINRLPISGSDKELVLINLHLEAYDDGEGKAKQFAMLMDTMQAELNKGNYVIAGGDFNQTFSTTDYAKYPKRNDWVCPVIDAAQYPDFTFRMDDAVPTCRSLYKPYAQADHSDFQYYMIDGFIVSGNVTINKLQTLDLGFKNTDHNPVVLSVTLP